MRWLMAACFALLGAVLWVVAPRYAWRGAAPSEAPAPFPLLRWLVPIAFIDRVRRVLGPAR